MIKSKYICSSCGNPTHEEIGYPHAVDDKTNNHYCLDCGMKVGIVEPLNYLELIGIRIFHHATYQNNTIIAFRKWGRGYRRYELLIDKANDKTLHS